MTKQAEEVKSAIIALSPGERAEIVQFLLESVDEPDKGNGPDAEEAWDREINRRADEVLSGKDKGRAIAFGPIRLN